ncbi:hypothetical protein STEG23_029580 [Scotinomys teguina]
MQGTFGSLARVDRDSWQPEQSPKVLKTETHGINAMQVADALRFTSLLLKESYGKRWDAPELSTGCFFSCQVDGCLPIFAFQLYLSSCYLLSVYSKTKTKEVSLVLPGCCGPKYRLILLLNYGYGRPLTS